MGGGREGTSSRTHKIHSTSVFEDKLGVHPNAARPGKAPVEIRAALDMGFRHVRTEYLPPAGSRDRLAEYAGWLTSGMKHTFQLEAIRPNCGDWEGLITEQRCTVDVRESTDDLVGHINRYSQYRVSQVAPQLLAILPLPGVHSRVMDRLEAFSSLNEINFASPSGYVSQGKADPRTWGLNALLIPHLFNQWLQSQGFERGFVGPSFVAGASVVSGLDRARSQLRESRAYPELRGLDLGKSTVAWDGSVTVNEHFYSPAGAKAFGANWKVLENRVRRDLGSQVRVRKVMTEFGVSWVDANKRRPKGVTSTHAGFVAVVLDLFSKALETPGFERMFHHNIFTGTHQWPWIGFGSFSVRDRQEIETVEHPSFPVFKRLLGLLRDASLPEEGTALVAGPSEQASLQLRTNLSGEALVMRAPSARGKLLVLFWGDPLPAGRFVELPGLEIEKARFMDLENPAFDQHLDVAPSGQSVSLPSQLPLREFPYIVEVTPVQ